MFAGKVGLSSERHGSELRLREAVLRALRDTVQDALWQPPHDDEIRKVPQKHATVEAPVGTAGPGLRVRHQVVHRRQSKDLKQHLKKMRPVLAEKV